MNRAQIERAEQASQFLAERRHLTEARVVEARESLLDELETAVGEKAAVLMRRKTYVEQVQRFEQYRQEAFAFLIAEGVLPEDDGLVASEAEVDRDRLGEFTRRQIELGEFLVSR